MSVTDIDKGWKQIVENLTKLSKTELKVGIFEDAVNEGVSVAQYAHINEFGGLTETGAIIPSRSFMRSTAEEANGWKEDMEATYEKILNGADVKSAMGELGGVVQAVIERKIESNIPPPNSPKTLARKKGNKTLIDTGAMLDSIRYKITTG